MIAPLLAALLAAGVLTGTVREAGSREPVPYAVVEVPALAVRTVADERGRYVLAHVPVGSWVVRASALGYQSAERRVEMSAGAVPPLEFLLRVRAVELGAVEVDAGTRAARLDAAGPAAFRLGAEDVSRLPALMEPDVLRAVQTLPAVSAASDFSTALYVRGGTPDQTPLRLDGAPLFNPYHLGGVFSAIDPGAVASLDVSPGGLAAREPGWLGGRVDIWTRDGGRDRTRGRGAVSLTSARAEVDGPLPGGRGSYLVSARHTYVDLASRLAAGIGLISQAFPYGFTDAHLKATHDVGGEGRVSASGYLDREAYRWTDARGGRPNTFDWGSHTAALDYRQPFAGVGMLRLGAAYGDFGSSASINDWMGDVQIPLGQVDGRMSDALVTANAGWQAGSHALGTGVEADIYRFRYDARRVDERYFSEIFPNILRDDTLRTLEAYIEDEWRPSQALALRLGARLFAAGNRGPEILPRVGARFSLTPAVALFLAAGRYAQAVQSLRDEESSTATFVAYDLLVATPANAAPSSGEDVVAGLSWAGANAELRVQGYAKRLDRLWLPPLPPDPGDAPALVASGYRPGAGTASGLEIYGQGGWGRWGIQGSYALAFASRTLDGYTFTPRYHRRHELDATGWLLLGQRGQMSLRLLAASGQHYTPGVGIEQPFGYDPVGGVLTGVGRPAILLGEHNSATLPWYWRVDIGARKAYHHRWLGHRVELRLFGEVLNLLNAKNVSAAHTTPYTRTGIYEVEYSPQLPLLPSFGVEWAF